MSYTEIYKYIVALSGYQFLTNRQYSQVIELRSLFIKLLHDDLGIGWTEIAKIMKGLSVDYTVTHSTLINAYKSWPKYEEKMRPLLSKVRSKLKEQTVARYKSNVQANAGKLDTKTLHKLNTQFNELLKTKG